MKHSDWKHRFKCRRSFYVLGAIALLPIIFGCQKAMSAKNHRSPPVPPAPAINPSPVTVPFAAPIKKYIKAFPTSFVSPDGRWVVGQNENGKQAQLSTIDGRIVKSLPIQEGTLFAEDTPSPWSPDSKKLLTLSLKKDPYEGDLIVHQFIDTVDKQIIIHIPGLFLPGSPALFSPNGQFVVAVINTNWEYSSIGSLVTWKIDQSPAFGPRIFPFRLNVTNIAWLDNRYIWVITRGRDLPKDHQLNYSPDFSADAYHSEIYLLDCITGQSRPVKELVDGDIVNTSPCVDAKGHLIAVVIQNKVNQHLEIIDPQTEKSIGQIALDQPQGRYISSLAWKTIGNPQHIYVFRRTNYDSGIDIRQYNQSSKTLGKTYHLNITVFPSIDNSGQVWGVQNGILVNFGKL